MLPKAPAGACSVQAAGGCQNSVSVVGAALTGPQCPPAELPGGWVPASVVLGLV